MYFFNLKALEKELKSGKISSANKDCYFIFGGLSLFFSVLSYLWEPMWLLPFFLVFILFLAHVNSCGDKKHFVLRYLAFHWVVTWRLIVIGLFFSGILIVFGLLNFMWPAVVSFLLIGGYAVFALFAYFIMMYQAMKRVSKSK